MAWANRCTDTASTLSAHAPLHACAAPAPAQTTQLYEMIIVRHGLMAVGQPFSGKSSSLAVLAGALTDLAGQGVHAHAACCWGSKCVWWGWRAGRALPRASALSDLVGEGECSCSHPLTSCQRCPIEGPLPCQGPSLARSAPRLLPQGSNRGT